MLPICHSWTFAEKCNILTKHCNLIKSLNISMDLLCSGCRPLIKSLHYAHFIHSIHYLNINLVSLFKFCRGNTRKIESCHMTAAEQHTNQKHSKLKYIKIKNDIETHAHGVKMCRNSLWSEQ